MAKTILSSREVEDGSSHTEKAAERGPGFITDRGKPAHVMLDINASREPAEYETTLAEAVAQPEAPDFAFDPPRAKSIIKPPCRL